VGGLRRLFCQRVENMQWIFVGSFSVEEEEEEEE